MSRAGRLTASSATGPTATDAPATTAASAGVTTRRQRGAVPRAASLAAERRRAPAEVFECDARLADVAESPCAVPFETAGQELSQGGRRRGGSRDQSTSARSTAASVSAISSPLNARTPDIIS